MLEKQMIPLTTEVQQWLASFDRLSTEEQLLVAKEIQRRVEASTISSDDLDMSPPSEEEMTYMASKLFQMYDEEERQNGCP